MSKRLLAFKIFLGLAIFAGFLFVIYKNVDPDFGWHLREGEWILQHHTANHPDSYTFTMAGHKWANHEWLVDTGLWWLASHDLRWVLVLIFTLLASIPFWFWLRAARHPAIIFAVYIFSIGMIRLIGVRPQLISFFLLWLVYRMLRRWFASRREHPWKFLLMFSIAMFVWANLHAGFMAAFMVYGLMVVGAMIDQWRKNKKIIYAGFWIDVMVGLVGLAVTFINPYGWKLHQEIFLSTTSPETLKYVMEWRSVLSLFFSEAFFIIGIYLFCLWQSWKKLGMGPVLTSVVFLAMFLKSVRMAPQFLVVAMPVVFAGMESARRQISANWKLHPPTLRWLSRVKIVFALLIALAFLGVGYMLYNYGGFPLPRQATNFMKEQVARGENIRLLNYYGWGGYLIYRAPEIKVFVDGRGPHWVDSNGTSAMRDYVEFFSDEDGALKILNKWGINEILIPAEQKTQSGGWVAQVSSFAVRHGWDRMIFGEPKEKKDLLQTLQARGWKIIYQDDIARILRLN